MAKFKEQMQAVFQAYVDEVGHDPVSLDLVAEWAVANGLYHPAPRSVLKLCREALADSLRQEKRLDAAGRWYRAKHPVRKSVGGVQLTLWGDIDTAPRVHMEESFAQRRRAIVDDCFQIKQDVDHYNESRGAERPIQLIIDFTDDVAELEAAREAGGESGAA
jgi:hypothetical protein